MVDCVRVPRVDGEATRQRLAEAGLLDHDREIVPADGAVYIPVTDGDVVPDDLTVVERELPERNTPDDPADLLDEEPSYERVGNIVLIDEDDPKTADRIARAIMQSDLPAKTVLNRASKIKGDERVRDWDVVAGNGTETVHREYGHSFAIDLDAVYFSPRLATERHRVIEQVSPDEQVFDMFAGVGPYVIPAASAGAEAVGVDINPTAIQFLRENARQNGVKDRVTAIEGDATSVASDWRDWADRLIMNLPHSAEEYLDTAIGLAGDTCLLHYYDIQHEDDPFTPGVHAIKTAAGQAYDVTIRERRDVRSYAPHERNICLDVELRRRN